MAQLSSIQVLLAIFGFNESPLLTLIVWCIVGLGMVFFLIQTKYLSWVRAIVATFITLFVGLLGCYLAALLVVTLFDFLDPQATALSGYVVILFYFSIACAGESLVLIKAYKIPSRQVLPLVLVANFIGFSPGILPMLLN